MRVAARILRKDLLELTQSKAMLLLVFVVPLILVLLVGQIRVRDPVLRVAIHLGPNNGDEGKAASRRAAELEQLLAQVANLSVTKWETTADLLTRAQRERIDLVADLQNGWLLLTPETRPFRLQQLGALGQSIAVSRERLDWSRASLGKLEDISAAAACAKADGGSASEKARLCQAAEDLRRRVQRSNSVPVPIVAAALDGEIRRYFPPVSPADRSAVPGLIALSMVFIPFLLASGAFAREREACMLEMLILAGKRNWPAIVAGKLALPITVAFVSMLLQILLVRDAFSLGTKPGLLGMAALQLLAALAAGLFGIAVSALIRSQLQAYLASAAYLLFLILLSGYLYPLEEAGDTVRFASYALPFSFSGPAFEGWLLRGAGIDLNLAAAYPLAMQCVVGVLLCIAAIRHLEKTI